MSEQKPLHRLVRVLREGQQPPRLDAPSRDDRAQSIAMLQRALADKRAKKARVRRWYALAAVAALAGGLLVGRQLIAHKRAPSSAQTTEAAAVTAVGYVAQGPATVQRDGVSLSLDGLSVRNGDRVRTSPSSLAELRLSSGTRVELRDGAELTFGNTPNLRALSLWSGKLKAHVSKLQPGDRFIVHTSDAEVEVRGTVFEVSLAAVDPSCGGGTPTRVSVTEGTVIVRRAGAEYTLVAGGVWPTDCRSPEPRAAALAPVPADAPAPTSSAPLPRTPAASSGAVARPDTLGDENDAFATALAMERRHELTQALSGFDRYLTRYPSGAHVESAMARRMLVLDQLDHARAVKAAREYLARWPSGFARASASAIVDTAPTP